MESLSHAILAYLYSGLTAAAGGQPFHGCVVPLAMWRDLHIRFKKDVTVKTPSNFFHLSPLHIWNVGMDFHDMVRCPTAMVKTKAQWRGFLSTMGPDDFL